MREIEPLRNLDATVPIPGSKSFTQRGLLVAFLAEGKSLLQNALLSEDSTYLMEALKNLRRGNSNRGERYPGHRDRGTAKESREKHLPRQQRDGDAISYLPGLFGRRGIYPDRHGAALPEAHRRARGSPPVFGRRSQKQGRGRLPSGCGERGGPSGRAGCVQGYREQPVCLLPDDLRPLCQEEKP